MKHMFKYSAAVTALAGALAFTGLGTVSAYGGGAFVGGAVAVTPTPTPTETPEVLGASTTLPDTGLSVRDALILIGSAGTFVTGIATMASGLRK